MQSELFIRLKNNKEVVLLLTSDSSGGHDCPLSPLAPSTAAEYNHKHNNNGPNTTYRADYYADNSSHSAGKKKTTSPVLWMKSKKRVKLFVTLDKGAGAAIQ